MGARVEFDQSPRPSAPRLPVREAPNHLPVLPRTLRTAGGGRLLTSALTDETTYGCFCAEAGWLDDADSGETVGVRRYRRSNKTMVAPPLLLTVEETAETLKLSRSKVYEMLAARQLPSCTIGRARRIPADALRAWIEAQVTSPLAPSSGAHD